MTSFWVREVLSSQLRHKCQLRQKIIFSNIAYENDTFITQFSEENRRLHH
jgi:hypothetical protein